MTIITKGIFQLLFVSMLFCQLPAFSQIPDSEAKFKAYFEKRLDSLDQLEGIWNISTIQQFYRYDTLYDVIKYPKGARVAIMRNGDHFDSYNLSGESFNVQFSSSDIAGVYIYKNNFKETESTSKASAVITKDGKMEISYEFPDQYLRFKFSDSYEEGTRVVNNTSWSRTYPETGQKKK